MIYASAPRGSAPPPPPQPAPKPTRRRRSAAQRRPLKPERQYALSDLRTALRMIFAEGTSATKAAERVGDVTMVRTLRRYARDIRSNVDLLRNSAAHTRTARLAHIDELLFKERGNPAP